jgi:cysteine desulfurase/selenocysteine lyase
VAYSYGRTFIRRGDEIAVSILEHHSNLLPWQMVARETGAALRFWSATATARYPMRRSRAR